MAIFTESYCQNILEGFMDKYKENKKKKEEEKRKKDEEYQARKKKIEANNKKKFNFQGISLPCYDTEDPERLINLANKNISDIKNNAAEVMWNDIDNDYDCGESSESVKKLDQFFKQYPKYTNLSSQMVVTDGQICDDGLDLTFKMKCKDPIYTKGRKVYLTVSFDSNDKIEYSGIDISSLIAIYLYTGTFK